MNFIFFTKQLVFAKIIFVKLVNKNILDVLEESGLELNAQTGGMFFEMPDVKVKKTGCSDLIYDLVGNSFESINVVDSNLFVKTFEETEQDLKLTLFK